MECAILYTDIRDFTGYSEQNTPEAVVDMLNRLLSGQVEAVRGQGGDVDKFVGDAMLAWFEGPDGARIKALMSRVEDGSGAAGQVLDDQLLIACGTGAVRLTRVQREGRGAQGADEFVRGYAITAGAVLA